MEYHGLHLARTSDVAGLLERGFVSDMRSVQAWAEGVYLAADRDTAALYDDGERQSLVVRARVARPFVLEIPESAPTIFAAVQQTIETAFGLDDAALVKPERLRRERVGLAPELTRILRSHGYDALEIRMPWPVDRSDQRSIHFGGNQLVVFDPAQVEVMGIDAGLPLPHPHRTPPALADVASPTRRPPEVPAGELSVNISTL